MYTEYFGLPESPFAITPDARYLYLSAHHREALAHLHYGMSEGGGFVQLTGDVDAQIHRAEEESWRASWQDESTGIQWHGNLYCAPEGELLLAEVPAGTITLVLTRHHRPVEGTELVVELAPGEERTVSVAE